MKKINILHVTQYLDIGGLETLIVEICKKLDKSLFNVSVLCLGGYDKDYVDGLRQAGVEIAVISKQRKFDFGFFFRVRRFVTDRKIDVLHAHSGCFFYAALFSLLAGVRRYIYTAHGLPVLNRLQDRVEDNIAALVCSTIVPVSQEIGTVLGKRMPMAKAKMVPILNGIDIDRYQPYADEVKCRETAARYNLPDDAFLVGTVGRLEPVKNYTMLLRAFAKLEDQSGRKPHLVLVGEGSCCSELQTLAADLGIVEQVSFLGMQYRVHEILPLLDVFVLSSLTEGTSISLLESQACGVPAVVTDVGGNGVVVRHGENGFVCQLHDEQAMTAALSQLQSDINLAQTLGRAARRRVLEEFDLNTMVRRYEELYRRAD